MKNLIVFTVIFAVITSFIVSPSSACTCLTSNDIPESYIRNPIIHIKVTEVENSVRERDIYDGQETIRYNTQEIKGYEMIKLVSKGGYELEDSQYYGKTIHFNEELLFDPNIEILKQTIHPDDTQKTYCGCSESYSYLKTDIQRDKEYVIFLSYSDSENIYKIQGILQVIDSRIFNQFYDLEPNSWVSFLYNKIYYSIENDLYFDVEDFGEDLSGVTEVQRHLQFLEVQSKQREIFEDDNNENQEVEDKANNEEENLNNTINNQLNTFKWLGVGVMLMISLLTLTFLKKRYQLGST